MKIEYLWKSLRSVRLKIKSIAYLKYSIIYHLPLSGEFVSMLMLPFKYE